MTNTCKRKKTKIKPFIRKSNNLKLWLIKIRSRLSRFWRLYRYLIQLCRHLTNRSRMSPIVTLIHLEASSARILCLTNWTIWQNSPIKWGSHCLRESRSRTFLARPGAVVLKMIMSSLERRGDLRWEIPRVSINTYQIEVIHRIWMAKMKTLNTPSIKAKVTPHFVPQPPCPRHLHLANQTHGPNHTETLTIIQLISQSQMNLNICGTQIWGKRLQTSWSALVRAFGGILPRPRNRYGNIARRQKISENFRF